jgi:hypothetical protein
MTSTSRRVYRAGVFAAALGALLVVAGAHPAAQSTSASPSVAPAAPAPEPNSVLSRDDTGRLLVRAVRISRPIRIDGHLDDAAYKEAPSITQFIQQVPKNGEPITERTEAWILYDDDNIYVSCYCYDQNPDRIVANDMRKDSSSITNQDNLSIAFDTFNDRRSGFSFTITPAGALRDGTVTEERSNFDWNTVFDGSATLASDGWIAEMAIPFKSLRYSPGRQQTWNVQLRRRIQSKNELDYLTRVNPVWNQQGIHHFSEAATLVGLEAPPAARNLEIKPYAISRLTTDLVSSPNVHNDLEPDAGFDLKYGLTKGLTADLTYNTDFAQVEADEAQVNLTRFSLSFPEKREFFLEGSDLFNFGRSAGADLGGDAPSIFYSRRIGLNGAREVPVLAGGRVTGKAGPWGIGILNIETKEDEDAGIDQTNFAVVRVRRDVLRRSNVGAMFMNRSVSAVTTGMNQVFGVDSNFAFYQSLFMSGYIAKTQTDGRSGDDLAYRAQLNYNADRYGLALDRLVVEKNFNPEIGFMRRENFRRNLAQARFSPRTRNNPLIRKFTYQASLDYITDNDNHLESREANGQFQIERHNSDTITAEYSSLYEFIPSPFNISRGVRIPVGGYSFDNVRLAYGLGSQHKFTGNVSFDTGSFYDGDKKAASVRGRVDITMQLGIEPILSLNWVDLPYGKFTDKVIGGRTVFTMTPRMFVAALVQYSSANSSVSTNLRFRWEYLPGSELFFVYTEGRSTLSPQGTDLQNRGLVVKINRLFRF